MNNKMRRPARRADTDASDREHVAKLQRQRTVVDCDDQPLNNAYEQRFRDLANAGLVAWQARHHTAWAQGHYAAYVETLGSLGFLPDGVRLRIDQTEPSAASLAEMPERDFAKGVRGKYAKRLRKQP